jgi:hypothetical protein
MSSGASFEMTVARVACVIAALALASCLSSSAASRGEAARSAEGGESMAAYQEGYADGCATASTQGRPGQMKEMRDAALYDKDADYRAGFTSGLASCRMGPPRF